MRTVPTLEWPRVRPGCNRLGFRAGVLAAAVLAVGMLKSAAADSDAPPRESTTDVAAPAATALPDMLGLVKQLVAGQAGAAPRTAPASAPRAPLDPSLVARTEAGLLEVHVRDMELGTLLEMLSYQARANIVASTSVSGRVSANLYAVSLEQALSAILAPNHYAYRVAGKTVYVGKAEEIAALEPPVTRVFRLRYVRPAEAAAAVQALLGTTGTVVQGDGQVKSGASSSGSSGRGAGSLDDMSGSGVDYVIVTAQADQLVEVERLLKLIDQRPKQVLIESTILRATLNETNELGVDFTFLGGVDFENVNSVSSASSNLHTGLLPSDKFQDTTFNLNTKFVDNVSSGGFTFGIIKNNIAAFIRALEEITDVVVVANPKIVALNKQEGEVIVGRRDGYLTTTVTQTAAIQTVDFLTTGTEISFRPIINDDGTVRLLVRPKDSNGGLTSANLPFEETTEATADLMVNDGDTVLIGGLFRERTVNSKSQIPGLGDIPGVGLLFGSRRDQTTREEVIILLTVHVLTESPQERAEFRGLLDDVERIRVGSRRGLLAYGRERLAQAYYHEAVRQLESGHTGLALLNVRMTLNNQPAFLPALKLQERLLNEPMWDDEGKRMRTFTMQLIERGQNGAAPPLYSRPDTDAMLPPPPSAPPGALP